MKDKKMIKLFYMGVFIVIVMGTSACKDSFIQPQPESFHTPSNTLTKRSGFEAILLHNRKLLAEQYYGFNQLFLQEYLYSDIAVNGGPESTKPHNLIQQITPTSGDFIRISDYWNTGYDGINYANIVLSNLDNKNVVWKNEGEKRILKAEALFHRSYWYYRLVNQFGDVPLVIKEVEEAKLDFYTYSREAILKQIRNDMEFAVQWLPRNVEPGKENQGAGYYLLTKIYLELRQFKDAVNAASQVIDGGGYALMTNRFGSGRYADDQRFNALWDLHEKENISGSANTESILAAQSQIATEGNISPSYMMYSATPAWWWTPVRDPSGARGTTDGPEGNPLSDSLGRGVGIVRPTPYYEYTIWQDANDLRHSDVNWFSRDEFYYNNPSSDYYGESFAEGVVGDTTRTWFSFPYNKLYVPDENFEHLKRGGYTDWYIYRVAGLYLLRAEAYYWQEQMSNAADDINKVRERANASPVTAGDVTIDYIFDERARELYLETPRKSELTRVAYIMAELDRDGYSLENMSKKNWYYDRVIKTNKYFREELTYGANTYKIRPYHVYWPIPQDEIDANQFGHINQNKGYPGAEGNVEPRNLSNLKNSGDK